MQYWFIYFVHLFIFCETLQSKPPNLYVERTVQVPFTLSLTCSCIDSLIWVHTLSTAVLFCEFCLHIDSSTSAQPPRSLVSKPKYSQLISPFFEFWGKSLYSNAININAVIIVVDIMIIIVLLTWLIAWKMNQAGLVNDDLVIKHLWGHLWSTCI